MEYISGEVGDLTDWNFIDGTLGPIISKCVSEAISATIKRQSLPIYASISGGEFELSIFFSTDETDENKVIFRESISDLIDWSLDCDQSRLKMGETLTALRAAVVRYEEALKEGE